MTDNVAGTGSSVPEANAIATSTSTSTLHVQSGGALSPPSPTKAELEGAQPQSTRDVSDMTTNHYLYCRPHAESCVSIH